MPQPSREVRVRAAVESDLPKIVAHYGPGGGESPWDPFADLERLRRIAHSGLLVAELDGTYVGFLYWYEARRPWYAPEVDRYARVSDLHVVPSAQGQGAGKALLREAIARTRSDGIGDVFLETDEDNVRAQRLYESVGFERRPPNIVRFRLRKPVQ